MGLGPLHRQQLQRLFSHDAGGISVGTAEQRDALSAARQGDALYLDAAFRLVADFFFPLFCVFTSPGRPCHLSNLLRIETPPIIFAFDHYRFAHLVEPTSQPYPDTVAERLIH